MPGREYSAPSMRSAATLGTFLDALAAAHAGRPALLTANDAVSFSQLHELATQRAQQLAALGVTKSTRVGVLLPNGVEWLACAFGALKLGALLVPLNTLWRRAELEYVLGFADVQLLVMTQSFLKHDYAALLEEICPRLSSTIRRDTRLPASPLLFSELPSLRRVVVTDGPPRDWATRFDATLPLAGAEWLTASQDQVQPEDAAVAFFTSGTTAMPKVAVHTHRSILTAARHVASRLGLDSQDRTWAYLPLFFTGGFVAVALATLSRGGAVLMQEVFDAGAAVDLMQQHQCTTFFAWPHQAAAIAAHPRFDQAHIKLRKGPGAQAEWAAQIFADDHQAVAAWGMTESGPLTTCSSWDEPADVRAGSHGRPVDGAELRVVDPLTMLPVAAGKQGELLVRGPTLMAGYYKVAPSACFTADGFFPTGDLASLDEHGWLHFAGRLKDVIKTAGANVAAAEVESVLQRHPAIKAAYVVGIPDPLRGENVAAVVVAADDTISEEDLLAHCRQHLAAYKVPRALCRFDENRIPLLGSGKVDKQKLRLLLLEGWRQEAHSA